MSSDAPQAATSEPAEEPGPVETIEQLRRSFFYGSRSNLSFKFLKDLDDAEFGDFVEDLLAATTELIDTDDASAVIDAVFRWQVQAYRGHLGDPADFPHRYDDVPLATLSKPLAESRVALVTSSGHFVEGDDPQPLGVENMTQQEAEARIGEFLKVAPDLSAIPVDIDPGRLRVRHGGYPVAAAQRDHQVNLPLGHLRDLAAEGAVGEVDATAYSFVGAASQVRLKRQVAPEWAERLRDDGADAVLLVPV